MKFTRSILSLPVLLAVASTYRPSAADAQTVAPVPAPTIIKTAPYTIKTSGYYQLGADLTYAGNGAQNDAIITIAVSNVILDLAGHFMSGPTTNAGTTLDGVYSYEKSNLTIKNGTIAHCDFSIYLDGNGTATTGNINHLIDNVLMANDYQYGLFASAANYCKINNCRISNITGSTQANQAIGVYFNSGTGNQVVDTALTNITGSGSGGYGVAGTSNLLVTNCVITNVTDSTGATSYGIYSPNVATGNTITNCSVGIETAVKYKDNVTVNCTTAFDGGTPVGSNN